MSCNHKKRAVLASGTWDRRDKTGVKSDVLTVLKCGSCGALCLIMTNEHGQHVGAWSSPNKENLGYERRIFRL